ncbi:MAG: hypothetical protein KBT36_02185 [Kurthia sp.]|nr:hypothetical protein [Candidatus Kurthia equi]
MSIAANYVTQSRVSGPYTIALPPRKYITSQDVEKLKKEPGIKEVQATFLSDDVIIYAIPSKTDFSLGALDERWILFEIELIGMRPQEELRQKETILLVNNEKMKRKYEGIIGKNVQLVRKDQQGNKKSWTYRVKAMTIEQRDDETLRFVINAKEAQKTALFLGYDRVAIELKSSITNEQARELHKKVSDLAALYNGVGDVQASETNNLEKLFVIYYRLSFISSLLLVVSCLYLMLEQKFKDNRYLWAIYLSQGMTKKQVIFKLIGSIPLLWIQSVCISGGLLLLLYGTEDGLLHPLTVYTKL